MARSGGDAFAMKRFSIGGVLTLLRDLGWTPGSIIDIGVSVGTPGLYGVWPGVPICLVEPSERSRVYMEQIAAKYPNVTMFNVGASNFSGELVGRQAEGGVNVLFGRGSQFPAKTFPVMRCDDIVAGADLQPPFLYKLDTDSHEREILEGSPATLARTELCIIEGNVFHGLRGCMTPGELWRIMEEHGFVFMDVADTTFGARGVLRGLDFVFARTRSPLFELVHANAGKRKNLEAKRARQYDEAVKRNVFI